MKIVDKTFLLATNVYLQHLAQMKLIESIESPAYKEAVTHLSTTIAEREEQFVTLNTGLAEAKAEVQDIEDLLTQLHSIYNVEVQVLNELKARDKPKFRNIYHLLSHLTKKGAKVSNGTHTLYVGDDLKIIRKENLILKIRFVDDPNITYFDLQDETSYTYKSIAVDYKEWYEI